MPVLHGIDLRYVEIEYELWAVREFLNVVEVQLAHLRDQAEVATRAATEGRGLDWEDGEVQMKFQELYEKAEYIFPRYVRGPAVITLCAAYESAVLEIAAFLERQRKLQVSLRSRRDGSFLDRARKHYALVLSLPLDTDPSRLARLADLYEFRNWLAHVNGRLDSVSPARRPHFRDLVRRHPENVIDRDWLMVDAKYLEAAYADVDASVRDLIARARAV